MRSEPAKRNSVTLWVRYFACIKHHISQDQSDRNIMIKITFMKLLHLEKRQCCCQMGGFPGPKLRMLLRYNLVQLSFHNCALCKFSKCYPKVIKENFIDTEWAQYDNTRWPCSALRFKGIESGLLYNTKKKTENVLKLSGQVPAIDVLKCCTERAISMLDAGLRTFARFNSFFGCNFVRGVNSRELCEAGNHDDGHRVRSEK